jgi:hypothetical protein
MAWRIEYDAGAEKDLSRLDRQIAHRIIKFLANVWPNWMTRAASVRLLKVPYSEISGSIVSVITASSPKYKTKSCAFTLSRSVIEKKFIDRQAAHP